MKVHMYVHMYIQCVIMYAYMYICMHIRMYTLTGIHIYTQFIIVHILPLVYYSTLVFINNYIVMFFKRDI